MTNTFKIPRANIDSAKHATGVYCCPHCNKRLASPSDIYKHIVGIADTHWGRMKVTECPFCFEKYYSHLMPSEEGFIVDFANENEHLRYLI